MQNRDLTARDQELIRICLTCKLHSCMPESKLCKFKMERKAGHGGALRQSTCGVKEKLDDVDVKGWQDARKKVNRKMGIKSTARLPGVGITFGRRR